MQGADCRVRNEMEDCGVDARSLRVAVERSDRIANVRSFSVE
jgi:hypothetical protein